MAGIKPGIILLGFTITLCLVGTVDSNDSSEMLSDSSLRSSINRARKMVDKAYLQARRNLKKTLEENFASPMDFLKILRDPVGRTRSTARFADYLETTLKLLRMKLRLSGKWRFNVTEPLELLSPGSPPWPSPPLPPSPLHPQEAPDPVSEHPHLEVFKESVDVALQDIRLVLDVLSRKQKKMISKETGCASQTHSIKCPKSDKYRTISGECNNRKVSHLGSSNGALARWLPGVYEDGFSVPRGATEGKMVNGFPLPLVREVSNEIALVADEEVAQDQDLSLVFMHWGQWVTHDLDFTPVSGAGLSPSPQCTSSCAFKPPCFPIKFPSDDPRKSKSCMPFIQSASVCNTRTFTREQLNAVTPFLDASTVYGSEDSVAKSLRNQTNQLGLLAVNQIFTDEGLELLPFENNSRSICILSNKNMNIPCFKAGDRRVSENLGLSALHTVFLRQHNRLVKRLKKLNPHWDGEKLYQESRKIIGAIIQIITYRDYLPRVLGVEISKWIPPYRGYKKNLDPRISNVFAVAFRFGHTLIQPFLSRLDENYQPLGSFGHMPLRFSLSAPWRILTEGGIDPLIRGMVFSHAKLMKQNKLLAEELQNHLFEQTQVMGLDLASLNLQRGRDHGLPGYSAWRQFCGLSQPQNLKEFSKVLGNYKLAKKFMKLYGTTDNIDLWIGAISEPAVPQGRVGPLLACIIGTQFRKLRDGDRFWWEKHGVFTPHQLRALKKISVSRLICDNTRIKKIPRDVFKVNSYPEDFLDCKKIDRLDLSPWEEEP